MPAFNHPGVQTVEVGVTDDGGTSFRTERLTITKDGHGRIRFNDGVKDIDIHDENVVRLFNRIAGLTA